MLSNTMAKCLATFFYLGTISKAPGTLGSIAGLALAIPIAKHGITYACCLFFIIMPLSFLSSMSYSKTAGDSDPSEVIIDEVAGQMLSIYIHLSIYPISSWGIEPAATMILNCILFRLFDIFKPFPISYVDEQLKTSASIVLDDLLAGVFSAITTVILIYAKNSIFGS